METLLEELEEYFSSVEKKLKEEEIIEYRYILTTINRLTWDKLSKFEKQEKRKKMLSILKETDRIKSKNENSFEYEEAIVNIYDSLLVLLDEIDYILVSDTLIKQSNFLVKRLKIMAILELRAIDRNFSFKNIAHVDISIFENINKELKKSEYMLNSLTFFMAALRSMHKAKQ